MPARHSGRKVFRFNGLHSNLMDSLATASVGIASASRAKDPAKSLLSFYEKASLGRSRFLPRSRFINAKRRSMSTLAPVLKKLIVSAVCLGMVLSAGAKLLPPTITCPSDTTVECGSDTSTNATGSASATPGTCSDVTVSFTDNTTPGANCAVDKIKTVVTRTWTASNACGIATCDQTITVKDTTAPVISCPGDRQLQCGEIGRASCR